MTSDSNRESTAYIQALLDEFGAVNQRELPMPVIKPLPRPRLHGRKTGNVIYMTRIVKHMTQATLAAEAGVSRRAIIDIENQRKAPSVFLAIAIAEALEVKVEDIFKLH